MFWKASFLCLLFTLTTGLLAEELSRANLKKLSKISDKELFEALLLTDFKLEALARRNEAIDGRTPHEFDASSKTLLVELVDEIKELEPLYEEADSKLKEDDDVLSRACRESYKFKRKLPAYIKKVYADTLVLKLKPYDQDLIRAQAWTRLQLLKNFFINSIASYASGEIQPDSLPIPTKCLGGSELYEKLTQKESQVLVKVDTVLNSVIGQPGIRSARLPSKVITQKLMQEEAYWNKVGKSFESFITGTLEETVYYYSGLGVVKYGFKTIASAPKAYKFIYPLLTGGIRGALGAIPKENVNQIDSKNGPAENVRALTERMRIYLPFGFLIKEEKLEDQVRHALEMEQIVFQERFDYREESNRLCMGQPCRDEQADRLIKKFERNKKEIHHIMQERSI